MENVLAPSVSDVGLPPSLQRSLPVHAFRSVAPEATPMAMHGMAFPAAYPNCESLCLRALRIPTDTIGS
eukprot:scaffold25930_cov22-Tisochrysis_lutea.AAC.2